MVKINRQVNHNAKVLNAFIRIYGFTGGGKNVFVKATGIICALIMMTVGFVGCIPVSAESENDTDSMVKPMSSYPGTYVKYNYEDCHDAGDYSGLFVYDIQVKDGTNWRYLVGAAYQTGFRYLDYNGVYQDVSLDGMSCSYADGTNGEGIHIHQNTFTFQSAHDGKITYIVSIDNKNSWFRFNQYLKWENTQAQYNIQGMNAWWKIEWAVNDYQGSGYNIGRKEVSGTWSDIQVASYGWKGSNWQATKWLQDSSHTTHNVYTDGNYGGYNNGAAWGDFDVYNDDYPLDYYDYGYNADGHTVVTSLGSEYLLVQYPISSGTLYGSWTEYAMQWT